MAKKREPIDDLIDAHVWMRRKTTRNTAKRKANKKRAATECIGGLSSLETFYNKANIF